ncbi:unnamed protein product [Sphagnum jensenii]|uniref:Uncharacterized protein n=1 Tax=Sphagnum jensenii TaxID=128206 RepID=A0ABP0X320_9BRYO
MRISASPSLLGEFCDPAAVAHAISLRILCVVVEVISRHSNACPEQKRQGMARYVLSVWTTTKIAAASFLVGVIVGFRLKNTIRKGAEKLLKRLQRD